jgi:tetratricopeptide (TPR) repeat protein
MLALLYAESGRGEEAREVYEPLVTPELAEWHTDAEWLFAMVLLADAIALLDDTASAAILYPLVLPYAHLNGVAPSEGSVASAARPLGALAGLLGRFDEAEAHFAQALAMNERMQARPWVARTKRDHAATLLRRNGVESSPRT